MAEKVIFSKIVTVRNGWDVKIAKMETIMKRDMKTLYFKAHINGEYNGVFSSRKDMSSFMVNKFYHQGY